MKVGILTFHASHNYGSMLQAYALQKVLSNFGIENEIINFRTEIQKSLIPPHISLRHPRSSLKKLIKGPQKSVSLLSKYNRFEKFLRNYLNVTRELSSAGDVAEFVKKADYDAIITGSDQIWNPGCWDFDMCYLVDFPFHGKRIAYAPSLGSNPNQISKEEEDRMRAAINRYDALSTRESKGKDCLSKITDKTINVVLDPTLLLDAKDYYEIANVDVKMPESYIFYYTPREESGYFNKAKELSYMTGLPILVTQDYPEYMSDGIVRKLDCGPREYLTLIKNATYTIGNSFHLLAVSLIFGKEFFLLSKGLDSRMLNILTPLGLQDRLIVGESISIKSPIEYSAVESALVSARNKSLNYLRSALNNK